jgi:hypothetical protein
VKSVRATRYLTPLREGGSVPAIVEADDCGTYVVKFRGAAQGARALIAEVIAGELGRVLGLPVPQLARVEIDPLLARSEPDPEIQATLAASAGANIGLDYLPGAFNWEPPFGADPALAAKIVWFDAFVTNVDRTAKNPNMLRWHKRLYLIDHGASLYFHHAWEGHMSRAKSPFAAIRQHALLPFASSIADADRELAPMITRDVLAAITREIPDELIEPDDDVTRDGYVEHLLERIAAPRAFAEEAERVRVV